MTSAAPPNTRYHLQLLATATSDSKPSLLVTFDSQRYLFNAPESISRVFVQSRIGMRKISKVFLGDLGESAGLPGFVLSTVEAGNHQVELVGPEGLDHLVATYRFFTRREQLSLKITVPPALADSTASDAPLLPEPIHADANMIVYAFPLVTPYAPSSPSASLKRKRSTTSPSPPPRAKSPPIPTSTASLSSLPAAPLPLDPSSPSFNPSTLTGSHACTWRSLVIADMFRGRHFLPSSASDPPPPGPSAPKDTLSLYRAARASGPTPSYLPLSLPAPETSAWTSVSYLGVGPQLRGKFMPEEAKKRGVTPGRDFARLTKGERVWVVKAAVEEKTGKLSKAEKKKVEEEKRRKAALVVEGEGEGVWVEPSECMGEGQEGSAFLVLNLPSPAFLSALSDSLPSSLFTSLPTASLRTILYFLGPGVLADPRLASFMASFPPSVAHRVSSPDSPDLNTVTFVPSALLSLRLSHLSPTIFRLPHYTFPSVDVPTSDAVDLTAASPVYTLLRPNDRFAQATTPLLTPSDVRTFDFIVPSRTALLEASRLKGLEKTPAHQKRAEEAWATYLPTALAVRAAVEAEEKERKGDKLPGDDLKVTPLGTGSAVPSKYRNVSSTLLHLPDGGYVLLDAGEGTWGQIARRFGEGESREKVLRGLKLVFISHMHQDHHAGLATVLKERNKLNPPPESPLVVICPPGIRTYLLEQQRLFDIGLGSGQKGSDICFVDCFVLEAGKTLAPQDSRNVVMGELKALLGLKAVVTVPVLHRCRCWGFVLEHESGWKTVFSGDTMPCESLVVAGQGASLLIHEATIEDDMPEVARAKGHSTFGQAIDIARRMNARNCLLTHFSARYPKLPPVTRREDAEEGEFEPTVAIAFDLATMRLDEFWKMVRYRAAMDLLFAWDEEEDDESVAGESVVDGASEVGVKKGAKKEKKVAMA